MSEKEWSLYETKEEKEFFLEPLKFSNGKTQQDVVEEVLAEVKKGTKIIFIHGVCGTGKCLDKDALVFCKPSDKKYFGNYKIDEMEGKNGKILSVDDFGNIIETDFKNVRKSGKKPIFRLITRTGREITTSDNHPFLTITKEGLKWKPLKELDDSHYICLPNLIKMTSTADMEDNKIKILAHLIAEGKCGDKAGSPKYYQDKLLNKEIREDYENALKKVFPDGVIRDNSQEVTIIFDNKDTRFGTTNKLRLFIREFGLDGGRSKDKFVPEIIFNLDKKKISLFLKTIFSCDGSIYIKKGKNREDQIIIEYCSISKRLILDISLLLNRFGIHHTITSKAFRKNKRYSWRINISNKANIKRFIEEIGFIGKKQDFALDIIKKITPEKYTNIDKIPRVIRDYLKNKGLGYNQLDRYLNYEEIEELRENMGFKEIRKQKLVYSPCVFKQGKIDFLRAHLRKVNEYIKNDVLSFICNDNVIWDKINSIRYLKEEETYDLDVPKHQNFIANGIIVHNSAIALNIAKRLGRASIVVPIKNLQKQYEEDYTNKKYLLKNGKKLKISLITGRNNHKCPFLKENKGLVEGLSEKNTTLDIFDEELVSFKNDKTCDNPNLPCKIEIKFRNLDKLREYLKKNEKVNANEFTSVHNIKRLSIAPICKHWSPIIPAEVELKSLDDAKKLKYAGLNNIDFIFYKRKAGCAYYDQFDAYLDSDVIIFNSLKYQLEAVMNRKPATEVEIIDECDEFLDSFSNVEKINMNFLSSALSGVYSFDERTERIIQEAWKIKDAILKDREIDKKIETGEIVPLKQTGIYDLLKLFLEERFVNSVELDEENYCYNVDEIAQMFRGFFDETYVSYYKEDKDLIIRLVTTNLEKRFKELADKNKVLILMSGTIHNEKVLKEVFGIRNFKIIDAETKMPGKIDFVKTGLEINCKYDNFARGLVSRERYLFALNKCVEKAEKPCLVHIHSFADLPDEKEAEKLGLSIISRQGLKELQSEDFGEIVKMFKQGKIPVLYSTKATRGIDFPGKMCESIVLTKYPYPAVKGMFWRVLKKTNPKYYNEFYLDKARREFLQRLYRGLRSENDHIYLLSPDARVFGRL